MTVYALSGAASTPAALPARGLVGRGVVPIAGRYARNDLNPANGTDVEHNGRVRHVPNVSASAVALLYFNPSTDPITIKAGVEGPASTFSPVFFRGQRVALIDAKGWVLSDPVGHNVIAATGVWTRTNVVVTSGLRWQYTHSPVETGEAGEAGAALGDKSTSGTIGNGANAMFGPYALVYLPAARVPVVVGLGDSIMAGIGSSGGGNCFLRIALDGTVSFINAGQSGERAADFINNNGTIRHALIQAGNWVVSNYLSNDLLTGASPASIKPSLVTAWQRCAAEGARVLQCTALPRSSAGDGSVLDTNNANRVDINTWLRDGSPLDSTTKAPVATGTSSGVLRAGQTGHPLAAPAAYPMGCIDAATAIETAQDSGIWAATYCSDGIHPSAAGHARIATVITLATFT